jgi:hypothetical protein
VVSDSAIRIRHGKDYFAWISMKSIVPEGKWRIWVRNNPSYDPVQELLNKMPEGERAKTKVALEKRGNAISGIARGRGILSKFFDNK